MVQISEAFNFSLTHWPQKTSLRLTWLLLELILLLQNHRNGRSWYDCCSVAQSCPSLCDPMNCSTPGLPVIQFLLKLVKTHVCWVDDAIQPSHPLFLPPSIFPSIRVFFSESALHIRWLKYWNLSFSISPSNEYLGLIAFRMDWFDLLAVQGTLRSLLQHHSSKSPILQHSAFFMVQLSHPYMTTGKTITLTTRSFVGKVMFLLFNTLSQFFKAFLPRRESLLI